MAEFQTLSITGYRLDDNQSLAWHDIKANGILFLSLSKEEKSPYITHAEAFPETPVPTANEEKEKDLVSIFVKTLNGETYPIKLSLSTSVKDLKRALIKPTGLLLDDQRLIFQSKQLEDLRTLEDYGIKDRDTLYLVIRLRGC